MPHIQIICWSLASTKTSRLASKATFSSIRKSLTFFSPFIPKGWKRSPSRQERKINRFGKRSASINSIERLLLNWMLLFFIRRVTSRALPVSIVAPSSKLRSNGINGGGSRLRINVSRSRRALIPSMISALLPVSFQTSPKVRSTAEWGIGERSNRWHTIRCINSD